MRRRFVFTTLIAVLALLPVASGALADELSPLPPGGTFVDDDDLSEEGYIEAIASIGVTKGCNPPANDAFCPHQGVTRQQMASFFVRALGLPAVENDFFVDDDGTTHEADINSLAAAGITRGCNPPANDAFCPGRVVRRGEMAAFIVRAFGFEDAGSDDLFDDDNGSTFEADIQKLATASVTLGCAPREYCPTRDILRRHMAVFLGRALQLTPNAPPPRPRVIGEFTTFHPAGESRVINIHLIADAVDGAIVEPGDTFSVNDHVGQRTEAKGYVAAGAIIGGELYCCDHPANIGGGTSQFSTTLYNAVFFAGLEDVFHRPHSIYFSRYPMGREATMGYPSPDVKFRNDTAYPIEIDTSHTSKSITVRLVGYNGGRAVETTTSGNATTSDGGEVLVTRKIIYGDGTTSLESWKHTYKPLPVEDEIEEPSSGPPPDDEGSGGSGPGSGGGGPAPS